MGGGEGIFHTNNFLTYKNVSKFIANTRSRQTLGISVAEHPTDTETWKIRQSTQNEINKQKITYFKNNLEVIYNNMLRYKAQNLTMQIGKIANSASNLVQPRKTY